MGVIDPFEDDDIELLPVPMDAATRRRLLSVSLEAGDDPVKVAASLLATLLRDDEDAHSIIQFHPVH
jgi:hypothetical protein